MRGDIFELRVDRYTRSHEQERHHVVVLQSDTVSSSTVVAAPTTAIGTWDVSFHPKIEFNGQSARVLVEQMIGMDPAIRFGRKAGRVSLAEQADIDRALKLTLGLF